MKNVPGRKTDVKDSEWIADLMRHGLIAKSFVPPKEIRELRDLLRFRRRLGETKANERNRTIKVLEAANVKLSSVVTDVFGKSGMAMLEGLAAGETDTDKLSAASLTGTLGETDRLLLKLCLHRLKALDADIAAVDKRAAKHLKPYKKQLEALQEILIAVYHVLFERQPYAELGAAYLDQRRSERVRK